MIVASYVFYGWWDWHIAVLAGVIVVNQLFVRAIASSRHRATARLWVGLAVTLDIACLRLLRSTQLSPTQDAHESRITGCRPSCR